MLKSELATMLLDTSHRPDLSARTDEFIRQAEAMIARDVRAMEQITIITLDELDRTAAGESTYTLPTNFLAERVIWAPTADGRFTALEKKSLSELRTLELNAPVSWFACRGLVADFRGLPAEDTELELDYFARLAALSETDADNVLLNAHEELYLSSALFFLHRYAQDTDIAQGYLDSFSHAAVKVNEAAMFRIGSQSVAPAYNFSFRASF